MRGIDILEHNNDGYKPVLDFNSWRVALMNDIEKNHPDKIAYLERHNETDEAFILLDGRCTLIFCTSPDQPDTLSFCEMEKGKVYNVKMGTWHTNLLYEGSKVLIVENLNTSKENSSYFYDLSEAQKEFILKSSI